MAAYELISRHKKDQAYLIDKMRGSGAEVIAGKIFERAVIDCFTSSEPLQIFDSSI